jgi:hypothetical protein
VLLACVLALDAADRTALGALAPALKAEFSIGNGGNWAVGERVQHRQWARHHSDGCPHRPRRVTRSLWYRDLERRHGCGGRGLAFAMLFVARIALGSSPAGGPPVTSIIGDLFSSTSAAVCSVG